MQTHREPLDLGGLQQQHHFQLIPHWRLFAWQVVNHGIFELVSRTCGFNLVEGQTGVVVRGEREKAE